MGDWNFADTKNPGSGSLGRSRSTRIIGAISEEMKLGWRWTYTVVGCTNAIGRFEMIDWSKEIQIVSDSGRVCDALLKPQSAEGDRRVFWETSTTAYSHSFFDNGMPHPGLSCWEVRNALAVSTSTPMEFGPEIKVDGVRPEWFGSYKGPLGYARGPNRWYGPCEDDPEFWTEHDIVSGRGWDSVTAIRLPASHPHYNLITHTYTVRPEDEAALLASDPLSRSAPDERAVAPELVERMRKLVELMASNDGACFVGEYKEQAREILAALEPVDEDLETAEAIMKTIGYRDIDPASDVLKVALAAIKRGRQLEKEGK